MGQKERARARVVMSPIEQDLNFFFFFFFFFPGLERNVNMWIFMHTCVLVVVVLPRLIWALAVERGACPVLR